jgi:hypothetical protein
MPGKSKILALYDTDWVYEWSMDQAIYKQEWIQKPSIFTQATKTAFLADTFVNNLLDRQIEKCVEAANGQMGAYEKTRVRARAARAGEELRQRRRRRRRSRLGVQQNGRRHPAKRWERV